jgi:prophage tail gpP-like protein
MTKEPTQLLIDSKAFSGWSDIEITLSMDSFDTVQFSTPFDPSRKDLRATFQPFSFKPIQVGVNGRLLFTGTMVGVDPSCDTDSREIQVGAYAKPGVLCDCTVPGNFAVQLPGNKVASGTYPRDFKKLTLERIAAQLCEPFGIATQFLEPSGAPFDYVAIDLEEKIHDFLVGLAKQRGLLITNTEDGSLLFWRASPSGDQAVVAFSEGTAPLTSVSATFSPQNYYSHITGIVPVKRNKRGSTYTVANNWAGKYFRPHACKFADTERGDAPTATNALMGRMFANCVSYTIEDLPTWRDPKGRLWEPNTYLEALAPSAMIYRQSKFLIRSVHLRQSAEKTSASLEVVLPGTFSGEVPKTLPWLD